MGLSDPESDPPDLGIELKSKSNPIRVPKRYMRCRFSAAKGMAKRSFRDERLPGHCLAKGRIYDMSVIEIKRGKDS